MTHICKNINWKFFSQSGTETEVDEMANEIELTTDSGAIKQRPIDVSSTETHSSIFIPHFFHINEE